MQKYKLEELGYKIEKYGCKDEDGKVVTNKIVMKKEEHNLPLSIIIEVDPLNKTTTRCDFEGLTKDEIDGLSEYLEQEHYL